MKRILIFACTLGLAACAPSESDRATQELTLLEQAGASKGEICVAKRKVEAAFLHENNLERFRYAKTSANVTCLAADLNATLGL